MPLVYLDTSHLVMLAKLRNEDATKFGNFRTRWRRLGVELALSRVHIHELRRHDDPATREARMELLADLSPVRLDSPLNNSVPSQLQLLPKREALAALVDRGVIRVAGWAPALDQIGFPTRLVSPYEIQLLGIFEDNAFGRVFAISQVAAEHSAKARALRQRTREQRTRLRELGARGAVRKTFAHMRKGWRGAARERGRARAVGLVRAASQSAISLVLAPVALPLAALAAYAFRRMVSADASRDANTFTDALNAQRNVRGWAESVLRETGVTRRDARRVAAVVKLEDFPGQWLSFYTETRLLAAPKAMQASDLHDLEHLAYAPYVDMFFADKRIREFARQAVRGGVPRSFRKKTVVIASAGDVHALEKALESLGGGAV